MDLTKGRNKRSVPIRYEQNQQTKYLRSPQNKNSYFNQQKKLLREINDDVQKDDNSSNQQYMQSSYLHKYSQNQLQDEGNFNRSYEQQDCKQNGGINFQIQLNKNESKKSNINHYELTFKKNIQQEEDQPNFNIESSKMNNEKSQAIDFQDDSQSYQQVQYDVKNVKEKQKNQNQSNDLSQLIENRQKLYQKYHSAMVNFYFLHSKATKTIEEKHKEYLLSLLIYQLHKNIFINGLKLNFYRIKAKKQTEKQTLKIKFQTQPEQNTKKKSLNKYLQESQILKRNEDQKSLDESHLEEVKAKLLIFEQITYGIMRKKLFECFDSIATISKTKGAKKHFQENKQFPDEKNNQKNYGQSLRSHQVNSNKTSSLKSKIHELQPYNILNSKSFQEDQQDFGENEEYNIQQRDGSYNKDQNSQNESSFEQGQQEVQYRKLQQLVVYIQQLKKQAVGTDSQLRRYFIKWKIYMLELILQEYHQQQQYQQEQQNTEENQDQEQSFAEDENQNLDDQSQMDFQQNQVQLLYTTIPQDKKRQDQNSRKQNQTKNKNNTYLSTPISQLTQRDYLLHPSSKRRSQLEPNLSSQNQSNPPYDYHSQFQSEYPPQNSIQEKSLILKSFLYEKYINQFWNTFSQLSTQQKLIIISQKLRQQKLKKNVFAGLLQNIEWKQKQKMMTEYYQHIAQQQDLSQNRTAQLFNKTNLKTKYFFEFIKICRELNCLKKLDKLTIKLSFIKIFSYSDKLKRKEYNIQRFLLTQTNKKLFKSFRGWKETTILSPDYLKIKSFSSQRNTQIISQYFSILQLIHKKSLVQQKKAFNFYKSKQTQKVFKYLQFLSNMERQNKLKQRELRQYLIFSKGKQFWTNFEEFYGEKVLQHRMKIRAQKLFYSRQKQFIFERLQDWRNFIIKKQSYQAIEYRLVRLRQKEVKQNILNIWLDELDKRMNKKDELQQSAQHKDWLVRYYGSLCDIATSGKISN